ncbi:MAG: hypothetical protein JWN76_2917 [Chitinophagaceae bacterium]|nr:hypothetical protein [Chitinophagaceae bacterium]
MFKRLIPHIFYGNVFYALCTVALCIETNLLAGLPENDWLFYLIIGTATIVFYTLVYYIASRFINPEMVAFDRKNRNVWYGHHRPLVRFVLIAAIAILLICEGLYFFRYLDRISRLTFTDYFLLAIFPLVSIAYSFEIPLLKHFRPLREAGILKPFVLGFAWAGFVTVYPVLGLKWEGIAITSADGIPVQWLFIQNFLFISLLCILFDIKDMQYDRRKQLNTIPVRLGATKTIFYVVIPLIILNMVIKSVYFFHTSQFFTALFIRGIPYVILLLVSFEVRKEKSTLYYLAVIDGMMLLKALTGIISTYL